MKASAYLCGKQEKQKHFLFLFVPLYRSSCHQLHITSTAQTQPWKKKVSSIFPQPFHFDNCNVLPRRNEEIENTLKYRINVPAHKINFWVFGWELLKHTMTSYYVSTMWFILHPVRSLDTSDKISVARKSITPTTLFIYNSLSNIYNSLFSKYWFLTILNLEKNPSKK